MWLLDRVWYGVPCVDPERGTVGSGPSPLTNHKNIGFLSNTLKITKLPSQHSMLGHYRPTSQTVFKWRADDGPLLVLIGSSFHSSKKQKQKNIGVGPPLAKLSESTQGVQSLNTFLSSDNFCLLMIAFTNSFGPRSGPTKLLVLIWIQTVWHSDSVPEIIFWKS